jgi:hypothetical protein
MKSFWVPETWVLDRKNNCYIILVYRAMTERAVRLYIDLLASGDVAIPLEKVGLLMRHKSRIILINAKNPFIA